MDESAVTTVYLIRHGATPANEQQPPILQGSGVNNGLSDLGRRQARQVGAFLATFPIDAVFCSPLKRAIETAQSIATPHNLTVETVANLQEVNVGRFERLDWESIKRDFPDDYRRYIDDPVNVGYPGGESLTNVQKRVVTAMESLLEANAGRTIAVVAHSVVNRIYVSTLLGLPLAQTGAVPQDNCCINVIQSRRSHTRLKSMNTTFHLE